MNQELWKPVITEQCDYTGLYEISNYGHIRSLNPEKIKRQSLRDDGYYCVRLTKNGQSKTIKTHILVSNSFYGFRPIGKEIDHKDGNPKNNYVDNLQFLSHRVNIGKGYQQKKKILPIGVHQNSNSKRFYSQIRVGNKRVNLGTFNCPTAAHSAYLAFTGS